MQDVISINEKYHVLLKDKLGTTTIKGKWRNL
jgi:hypothetical protein